MSTKRHFKIERDGPVATLTFDWPEKRNTMGRDFSEDCLRALDSIERDMAIRVLVLTGAGRAFCGGGDLFEIMSTEATDAGDDHRLVRGYNKVAERLFYFDHPVIAAVNGPAVGGGAGLALACDFAIATPSSSYDIFFGRLGLSGADVGVPWLLSRHIGPARANYYMYTAGSIDADAGLRLGLFAEIVAPEQLLPRAKTLASAITATYPATAARITKIAMRHGPQMEFRAALEYEAYLQAFAFQSRGHKQRIGEYRQRIAKKEK